MDTLSSVIEDWKESILAIVQLFESPEGHTEGSSSERDVYTSSCGWLNRVEDLELVLDSLKSSLAECEICIANKVSGEDSLRSVNKKLCALHIPVLPESIEIIQQLRIDDSLACFIDDFYESLSAIVREIAALSRPSELPGIITLSPASCSLGNSYLNGNMRKM